MRLLGAALALIVVLDLAPAHGASPGQQAEPSVPAPHPAQASPASGETRQSAARPAVIRGRVIAADTGEPIRRARVGWSFEIPGSSQRAQPPGVVTDNLGRFEIANLPAGRYRVFARRGGYLMMDYGARRARVDSEAAPTGPEKGVPIDLAAGQAFDGADFQLPRASVIAGRILDEFGDPIIGATVLAGRVQSIAGRRRLMGVASDFTDDQGEYRLSGLTPGSYLVFASYPAIGGTAAYAGLFYPGVSTRDEARAIALQTSQQADGIDMMLPSVRLATVSGTIVTSRGTAPRTSSLAVRHDSSLGTSVTVYAGAATPGGSFRLPSLPPGEYELVASVPDLNIDEVGTQHVSVRGQDIADLLIYTGADGVITGSVKTDTGAALPVPVRSVNNMRILSSAAFDAATQVVALGVENGDDGILARTSTPGRLAAGSIATNGAFSASVRPGPRVIDIAGLPGGWGVASVMVGDRDLTDLPVDVQPRSAVVVQIVVSERLPEISGTALDETGKPDADCDVVLFPREMARWLPGSASVRVERTSQRGVFRFTGLRPGRYHVTAVRAQDEVDWADPDWLYRLRATSTPVTVGIGEKKTVDLKVSRPVVSSRP